jgi:hypothetical protein
MLKNKYTKFFKKVENSKQEYQKELLNSSFLNKFNALIRLQDKALFFGKVKYKFNESFNFEKIVDIIEDLKEQNLIIDFCLGGATALLYYSTPHLTEDIDIFINLKRKGILFSLTEIYEYLKITYNAKEKGEFILINDNPIQFLLPGDKLTHESFDEAKFISINGKKFKIFSLEFLIAIMLNLNKSKYKERLRIVKEENQFNSSILTNILKKYKLIDRWDLI